MKVRRGSDQFRRTGMVCIGLAFQVVAYYCYAASQAGPGPDGGKSHIYVVEHGETLGSILEHYDNEHRLWGRNGLVVKTWKMNQDVVKKEGDFILPGTKILIPDELFVNRISFSRVSSSRVPASIVAEPDPLPPVLSAAPAPSPAPIPTPRPSIAPAAPPSAPVAKAPALQPAVKEVPKEPSKEAGEWAEGSLTFTPTFDYFRISSQDTANGVNANLVSMLSPGLDFKWIQKWSDQIRTFLSGGVESTTIATDGVVKNINDKSNTVSHMEIGVAENATPRLQFTQFLGISQELTATASSLTNIQIDENFYPKAGAGISYRLFERKHTALALDGAGFVLLPESTDAYRVNFGYGYDVGVALSQDLSASWHLVGGASYLSQTQNTTLTAQTLSEYRFSFGFSYSY